MAEVKPEVVAAIKAKAAAEATALAAAGAEARQLTAREQAEAREIEAAIALVAAREQEQEQEKADAAMAEAREQARMQAEEEAQAASAHAQSQVARKATATAETEGERPPDVFTCPITQDLMIDPVLATDGHTYERRAIEDWLVSHSTSPMTGAELEMKAVFPNHVVRGHRSARGTRRSEHLTLRPACPRR